MKLGRPERQVQFAKSVKTVDWLKTELLDHVSSLFKGLYEANQHLIIEALASLIVVVYVLVRRIGLNYREIDQKVNEKLREHIQSGHQLEQWYGDLSALREYINKR